MSQYMHCTTPFEVAFSIVVVTEGHRGAFSLIVLQ